LRPRRTWDRLRLSPDSCNPRSRPWTSLRLPSLYMQPITTNDHSGPAQVLWWPCTSQDPRTVLLFIPGPRSPFPLSILLTRNYPGNPGLLDFYIPFLDAIYNESNSPITIFAHAHLGLSSYIGGDRSFPDVSSVSLQAQIQAHVEFLDELLAAYGPETNVVLVGHSIGAWFIQEMLKSRTHRTPHWGISAIPRDIRNRREPKWQNTLRTQLLYPAYIRRLTILTAHLSSALAARSCISLHARTIYAPVSPPLRHAFMA
jgi:pimeloyl-ACP methyl ester carboxylesterase